VPPSDGIPLVDAYGVLGMAWGAPCIIAWAWPQKGSPLAISDFFVLGRLSNFLAYQPSNPWIIEGFTPVVPSRRRHLARGSVICYAQRMGTPF
jgi:hypothetical protein